MPEAIIARQQERKLLKEALSSPEPELIAIWGRRRIGKTFLIKNTRLEKAYYFELTGVKDGTLREQLFNFSRSLAKTFHDGASLEPPQSWGRAFVMLTEAIERPSNSKDPVILFFDEAPWLDSRKSGYLNALEHFWNSWASINSRLKVIVCGSASSWILDKIVRGKGGWHRRVTRRIHLRQFTLAETKEYLESRRIRLSATDLIELYMILGGTAQYLKEIKRGETIGACINRICFDSKGMLCDEFEELYRSIFNSAEEHMKIVTALGTSRTGYTKTQIREKTDIGAGRQFTQMMENLCDADFVSAYHPFGQSGLRDLTYRLTDFFSIFYLRWMRPTRHKTVKWQLIHNGQAYRSWAGFTFELLVWHHIDHLLKAVGLQNVATATTKWRHTPSDPNDTGAEVDLLIDADKAGLLILELKHRDKPYEVTKAENDNLVAKRRALEQATRSKRSIFIHMLASGGVRRNQYSDETVDYIYETESLF